MKKIFSIILFLILIYTSSAVNAAAITDDLLSNNIRSLNSILENKIDPTNPSYLTEIVDENNNIPAYQYYPTQVASRSITTLKAYDGKIFMGLGDWNANTGPVKIIYYDTTDDKIKTSGTIPDEAVQSFNIIDGTLYTTGCDPRANWGYGSYYTYNKETNSWNQHEKNNGWIHVFDIEKFKDKLFMSGSTVDTTKTSSIQSSSDGGETFQSVPVFKDGTLLPYNSDLRCYELIKVNNKLFAYIVFSPYTGIYEYDENTNQFNYISSKPTPAYLKNPYCYELYFHNTTFFRNIVFNDTFIYVTGSDLKISKDLKTFTSTTTGIPIQDVVVVGDTLYILSYVKSTSTTYTIKICSTKDLVNFNLVYEFTNPLPPLCIEYYNNSFYVGLSFSPWKSYSSTSENGALYRINLENTKKSLILDKDAKTIEISDNIETCLVNYALSEENSIFETTLNFNNTMSKKEWEQEYYNLKNLSLIFAIANNSSESNLEKSMSYYNDIISKTLTKSSETYSSAIEYANAMLAKELNIEDEYFTLTTKSISKTEDEYTTQVVLTINNKTKDIIKPSEDDNNSQDNKPSEDTNNSQNNTVSSNNNSNNNMTLEDYLNNKHKLPQTGEFFGLKHLLKIIILSSLLLLGYLAIKENK